MSDHEMAPSRNATYNCETTPHSNATTSDSLAKSELHALLYIVVTLLFYSLGIIVGIVLYLKREKREMEEDKLFDEIVLLNEDPYTKLRFQKVQQVTARLNYLQEQKKRKEEALAEAELIGENSALEVNKHRMAEEKCVNFKDENVTLESVQQSDPKDTSNDVFKEDGESLSAVVAKLLDPTKRSSSDGEENVCNEETEDVELKMPQTLSMQSIKDYEDEPRRSERSSLCASDDCNPEDDTSKLLDEKDSVFDTESKTSVSSEKTLGGCVVTNV